MMGNCIVHTASSMIERTILPIEMKFDRDDIHLVFSLTFSFHNGDDEKKKKNNVVYYPSMHQTMIKQMQLISTMNQSKDVPHSFARGFDDFDVTWPPSTNTSSINDDK